MNEDNDACTMEFRYITLNIIDSTNHYILLDDYFTVVENTGDTLRFYDQNPFTDSLFKSSGTYIIATDNERKIAEKTGSNFIFHGFMDKIEVIREQYILYDDNCHIQYLSGKTKIILNN